MATLFRAFTAEASRQADSACTVWRDARCRAASPAGTLPRRWSRRNAHNVGAVWLLWGRHSPEWRFSARQSGDWRSRSDTNRAGLAVMAVTARLGPARNLKSQCAPFLVADTDRFFHLAKEDFSVADISRRCCLQNRIDSGIHQVLRQHQLQLDFRQKIDGVFPASVDLRVTFLTSVAAYIGDGHSADAQFGQDFLDSLEPGRLDDRF